MNKNGFWFAGFPHDRIERLTDFHHLDKAVTKVATLEEKRRPVCCRGVLICGQTCEPVHIFSVEGGRLDSESLISQREVIIYMTPPPPSCTFPLTQTQYMHAATQRRDWKVLCGVWTWCAAGNWLPSIYHVIWEHIVPFKGKANPFTLVSIALTVHMHIKNAYAEP